MTAATAPQRPYIDPAPVMKRSWLEPDWDDDDYDELDDDLSPLGVFFDRGFVPVLVAAATAIAALVASGAVYLILRVWVEIVDLAQQLGA